MGNYLGFRIWGLGFRVLGFGVPRNPIRTDLRVQGSDTGCFLVITGLRCQGLGLRGSALGFTAG